MPDDRLPLEPGQRIALAEATGFPTALLPRLTQALRRNPGCELLTGWVLDPAFRPGELAADIRSMMGGPVLGRAIAAGSVMYSPHRYSQIPGALAGPLRPDVVLVQVRPHAAGFALAGTASWTPAAIRAAQLVAAEVNRGAAPLAAPVFPADAIVVGAESDRPLFDMAATEPSPEEEGVADQVLSFLPLPCVLQYGPGGVASAVLRRLAGQPVRLHSGLITEAAVPLLAKSHVGRARTTLVLGPAGFYDEAAAADVELIPAEESHSIPTLAATKGFVALNTALQVDLAGAVNVERVPGSVVGGVGGHSDFALAATLSDGGLSIIAFPSQRRGASSVVARLDVPTTTARVDVDVFVTEHGVADVRALDERRRAEALIRIAHPSEREELTRAFRLSC